MKNNKIKIVFFWTPEFSSNILQEFIDSDKYDVKAIVTQIDKKVWRKQEITSSQVKKVWLKNNFKLEDIHTPKLIKNNTKFLDRLKSYNADYFVVVAYGKILPLELLNIPKDWCINLHVSKLPKYRWASPIQSALLNGDTETWITVMQMDESMDTGNIIDILNLDIKHSDTSLSIFNKIENIWWEFLLETLYKFYNNEINSYKQNDSNATYCSKIKKSDWEILKIESSKSIYNKYQAYTPWPWIYTKYNNKTLKLLDLDYIDLTRNKELFLELESLEEIKDKSIFTVIEFNKKIYLKTKNWYVELLEVQLEWKKRQEIWVFIRWYPDFIN